MRIPSRMAWSPRLRDGLNNLRRATVPDRMGDAPEQSAHAGRGVLSGQRERESLGSVQQVYEVSNLPDAVSDASGHCWRAAERLVDAAKIVVREVERARKPVHLYRLAESIGEASKSAHGHAHSKVVSLRVASANLVRSHRAQDRLTSGANTISRGVARRAVAVDFNEHAVVNWRGKKCRLDRCQIGVMAISGEVDAIGETRLQEAHEMIGALGAAIADIPRRDELGLAVDGNPCPHITPLFVALGLGLDILLLRADERPYLIALDVSARKIDHRGIAMRLAGRAKLSGESRDCFLGRARNAARSAETGALDEAGDDGAALLTGELIHGRFGAAERGPVEATTNNPKGLFSALGVCFLGARNNLAHICRGPERHVHHHQSLSHLIQIGDLGHGRVSVLPAAAIVLPAIQVDVPGDAISPIRDVAHLYSQTHLRATARPRLGRSGLIAGVDLQHPPGQNFGQPSKIPRQIPGTSAGHFRAAVNSEMAACSGHPGGLHHHPGRDRSVCWAIVVSPSDLYFRAHIFLSFARLTGPRSLRLHHILSVRF